MPCLIGEAKQNSSKQNEGYLSILLKVKCKKTGAPKGMILESSSANLSPPRNILTLASVSAFRTYGRSHILLGQLKLNTVFFFGSARAVDSNDVSDYIRDSRPFTAPRGFDLSLDELDVVWMAVLNLAL